MQFSGDGFGDRPKTWWTYFTNWTFVLFAIWSVLGIYVTAVYVQVSLSLHLHASSVFRCFLGLQMLLTSGHLGCARSQIGVQIATKETWWHAQAKVSAGYEERAQDAQPGREADASSVAMLRRSPSRNGSTQGSHDGEVQVSQPCCMGSLVLIECVAIRWVWLRRSGRCC